MDLSPDDTGEPGGTDAGTARLQAVTDDVAFLARSAHRVVALDVLARHPCSRTDLRELTGVSASTISRTLGAFERRNWIRRDGHQYVATELGRYIASGMRDLLECLETERRLRGVWRWLPAGGSGFTVEMCADAVVTVADAVAPYRPLDRFRSLLRETDRFRFVGSDLALLEPCRDEFRRRVLAGMRAEIVDPPDVAKHVLEAHPSHCAEPLASGNLTVRVHDDVPPYGVALFDDRVGVVGYDATSGTVHVLLDTASPAARDWAESTFERYRREARPLSSDLLAE